MKKAAAFLLIVILLLFAGMAETTEKTQAASTTTKKATTTKTKKTTVKSTTVKSTTAEAQSTADQAEESPLYEKEITFQGIPWKCGVDEALQGLIDSGMISEETAAKGKRGIWDEKTEELIQKNIKSFS